MLCKEGKLTSFVSSLSQKVQTKSVSQTMSGYDDSDLEPSEGANGFDEPADFDVGEGNPEDEDGDDDEEEEEDEEVEVELGDEDTDEEEEEEDEQDGDGDDQQDDDEEEDGDDGEEEEEEEEVSCLSGANFCLHLCSPRSQVFLFIVLIRRKTMRNWGQAH